MLYECVTHYIGLIWEKTCPNSGEGDVIINLTKDLNTQSIWVKRQLSILIVLLHASRTNLYFYISNQNCRFNVLANFVSVFDNENVIRNYIILSDYVKYFDIIKPFIKLDFELLK